MSTKSTWEKQAAELIKAICPPRADISKAAQIRAILPELEDAMRRGVSQTDLIAALAETGLQMTLDELRNALYRERKRLKRTTRIADEHQATPAPKPPPKALLLQAAQRQENPPPASGFNWQKIRERKTNW